MTKTFKYTPPRLTHDEFHKLMYEDRARSTCGKVCILIDDYAEYTCSERNYVDRVLIFKCDNCAFKFYQIDYRCLFEEYDCVGEIVHPSLSEEFKPIEVELVTEIHRVWKPVEK